ncbi:MAG: glycosyltransferase family 2 protein [Acidimicrobiia bacterium]
MKGRVARGGSYAMVDVDVTESLPAVTLSDTDSGLAVLVRRQGRPVGFFLTPVAPRAVVSPETLGVLVSARTGVKLLQEAIREELAGRTPPSVATTLTVAVCTRDRVENLAACLESLLKIRRAGRRDLPEIEILVVDNAPSGRESRHLVESLTDVRYVREPAAGLDFARNRAIAEARGEFLAFVDDDVVLDGGWLEGFGEALAENPDAAAVTGLVLPYELATSAQVVFERRGGFRRGFEKLRYSGSVMAGNSLYPCGAGIFGAGCNMVFRREVLVDLGGFDDALDTGRPLPGGGDLDMFYRVLRSGHALVYEPVMLAFHKHRRDYRALRRQYWTWGTGFGAFVHRSYRADPEMRRRFTRLVAWWLFKQLADLVRSARRPDAQFPELGTVELLGGVAGLTYEYPLSKRRTERIRRRAYG